MLRQLLIISYARIRLSCSATFRQGAAYGRRPVPLDKSQAHYLGTVLRLRAGERVLVSTAAMGNGALAPAQKRAVALLVEENTRPQAAPADLHYLFAPIKAARLDYMVQKAVEMGVSLLQPVLTQHGQVSRVSRERMLANAVEAAEQCGLLSLPEIKPLLPLTDIFAGWIPSGGWFFATRRPKCKAPSRLWLSYPPFRSPYDRS